MLQHWLVEAKKKFARHDDDGTGPVRVAAVPDPPDAARPAPAGN